MKLLFCFTQNDKQAGERIKGDTWDPHRCQVVLLVSAEEAIGDWKQAASVTCSI